MVKTKLEHLLQQFTGQTMLIRLGYVHELAEVIIFLATDANSYIIGSAEYVDGGMRM